MSPTPAKPPQRIVLDGRYTRLEPLGPQHEADLFARHIFEDLGYRRFEWKCNDRNEPSKAAAKRFGFTYEGLFRQHMIVKGQNRDTAWFSMLDGEWPNRKAGFERWLDPGNFDAKGQQKSRLSFS